MCRRSAEAESSSTAGRLWRLWAVLGVVAVLIEAITKLAARGIDTVRAGLDPLEWSALVLLTTLLLYGEGVRALQRRWVPRVLERSAQVARERALRHRLLAPLYAMLLIGAPRRTLVRAWAGVLAIVTAVLIVRSFPEPWRGITDLAVAAALTWGLGSLLLGTRRLFR